MINELLALDPGDTTGYAIFDTTTGEAKKYGTVKGPTAFYELLYEVMPGKVVIEDYLLFPWKSKEQSWSKLDTVRLIGATELYCHLQGIPIIVQPPNIKGIAYKWAGLTPAKNHKDSHAMDAYVHGVYYLQSIGIRTPQQGRTD